MDSLRSCVFFARFARHNATACIKLVICQGRAKALFFRGQLSNAEHYARRHSLTTSDKTAAKSIASARNPPRSRGDLYWIRCLIWSKFCTFNDLNVTLSSQHKPKSKKFRRFTWRPSQALHCHLLLPIQTRCKNRNALHRCPFHYSLIILRFYSLENQCYRHFWRFTQELSQPQAIVSTSTVTN